MDMSWVGWVSVLAVLLAAAAVTMAVLNRRAIARNRHRITAARAAPLPSDDADHPQVAFVANPTKPGVTALRDAAVRACAERYLPEPLWFDTTVEDPGVGQARRAIEAGADVVVAVGGDGTVRAVAEGLIGSDAALALLPQGTGNLLARNLDLPLGDNDELLRIALTGRERPIDVGWLTVERDESDVDDPVAQADPHAVEPGGTSPPSGEDARRHLFLVIAGLGFDAAMVADTDEELKARMGWIAYFVAGVRHLHSRRMRLELSQDGSAWQRLRLRSVLIGNCGRLPGGITLLPDAEIDDGWLDIGTIDTRGGIVGWGQLFGEVTMQRFGVRTELPNKIGRIDHSRARTVAIRSREAQQLQVDGDTIGPAFEVSATVDQHALRVRVD